MVEAHASGSLDYARVSPQDGPSLIREALVLDWLSRQRGVRNLELQTALSMPGIDDNARGRWSQMVRDNLFPWQAPKSWEAMPAARLESILQERLLKGPI